MPLRVLDMPIWLIVVLLLAACALMIWLAVRYRTRSAAGAGPAPAEPAVDVVAEEMRRRALQQRGTELIERRVDLDMRRGPLGGDVDLAEELDRLSQRLASREIDEREFESEKIRLLGG